MSEQKMYSIVVRHLSGMQKGIQSGHSNVEYGISNKDPKYKRWQKVDKTVCVLETTSVSQLRHAITILNNYGIKTVPFYEPDLDCIMTSFSFLLPEEVWGNTTPENQDLRAFILTFNLAQN